MKKSLRSQLSISYVIMALLLVAAITIMINFLFLNQFKNYVISQQQQKNHSILMMVENQYRSSGDRWDAEAIQSIGINALEQGIIMKVKDKDGNMLWDATVHNNGMCVEMLQDISGNMQKYNAGFKGGYVQTDYPITVGTKIVGSLSAGYFGPYYYTENDIYFLHNINKIMIAVAGLSLIVALILAAFMARRIIKPISEAVNAAGEIAKGNYTKRIEEKSGTQEISKLTDTINGLADSLEKQQSLRKRMSADVAHELRTPLANLQSSVEAMIDGVWQTDTENLLSCHEEILRINRLVGSLERLEHLESKNSVLNFSEFHISVLLNTIIKNFEPEFYKKNIRLDFIGEPVTVCADKDKISQVIVNLIANALKYTTENGNVTVTLKDSENFAEFSVSDSGIGISEEDLPYIFERFYRSDKSRTRLTGGLGLGLTISKAIIDAHNGRINVISEESKGTTFTVILPKEQ